MAAAVCMTQAYRLARATWGATLAGVAPNPSGLSFPWRRDAGSIAIDGDRMTRNASRGLDVPGAGASHQRAAGVAFHGQLLDRAWSIPGTGECLAGQAAQECRLSITASIAQYSHDRYSPSAASC